MAKEDFCFTYYDGDAARDMAHMNRLERGGYGDLIVSQRKFGHLPLSLIKKTLGNDFENIWPSLMLVLDVDDNGKYHIPWVSMSVERSEKFSYKQTLNGRKGGRPRRNIVIGNQEVIKNCEENENPNETQTKPKNNPNETQGITQTITQKKPLGDGYVFKEEVSISKKINSNNVKVDNSKSERIEFENIQLQETWEEWIKYRSEIKHVLKPTTRKKQIDFLSEHPPDTAIAMLNQSMRNGWQGIFELKNQTNAKSNNSTNGKNYGKASGAISLLEDAGRKING